MLSHMVSAAGKAESDGSIGGALVAGIEGAETEVWLIIAHLLTSDVKGFLLFCLYCSAVAQI